MSAPAQPDVVPLDWPLYGISPGGAVRRGFTKYATFAGRASRSEFWWWVAFVAVAYSILGAGALWFGTLPSSQDGSLNAGALICLVAMAVFLLGAIVPSVAVSVRRLHDAGHSGWLYLLSLIPSVGSIIVLVLCALPTSPAAERYGPPGMG